MIEPSLGKVFVFDKFWNSLNFNEITKKKKKKSKCEMTFFFNLIMECGL